MKKLNKFFAVLVALAMMATMCVVMAFAEPEDPENPSSEPTTTATVPTASEDDAKLVKYLQAGKGVVVPEGMIFNFTLTPDSTNPATVATQNVEIKFKDMKPDDNGDYVGFITIKEIFKDVTFDKAGDYKFTADEVATTGWSKVAGETLDEDQDAFTVHLYVKNNDNGTTSIDKVTVEDNNKKKQDPSEKKDIADQGQDEDGNNIGLSFTNTFRKNLTDADDTDDSGLIDLTKTVTGDYADKTYKFPFELTYKLPDANNSDVYYKVLKDGKHENEVTEVKAENGKIAEYLGHGDKLIITKAPQGLEWATKENLSTVTNAQLQKADEYQATANGKTAGKHADASTDKAVLTTHGEAAYINNLENEDVGPEGILISNLPYIALALVAVGGLVAYVVVRRKADDEA